MTQKNKSSLPGWAKYIRHVAIVLAACFAIIMLPAMLWHDREFKALEKNGERASAVIDSCYVGKHGRSYRLSYHYFANGSEYQGAGEWYFRRDTVYAGGAIEIIYDRTKPSRSKTKRDFEKYMND